MGHSDTYSKHEYAWGIVRTPDGNFIPTSAVTNKLPKDVFVIDNPAIMKAKDDRTLVGVGHNHPGYGELSHLMSGYGHPGDLIRVGKGDKGVGGSFGGRIFMTHHSGFHRQGDSVRDQEMDVSPSGPDFKDLVALLREGK